MRLPAAYRGLFTSLRRYWADYGGWRDLLASPLFHLSVLVAAASYRVWLKPNWVEIPLATLPNLLGFSLGAYALIFSLASERLLAALNAPQSDGQPTLSRMINATFLHFILIQTGAIVFALSQKATLLSDVVGQLNLRPDVIRCLQFGMAAAAGLFGYWLTVYAIVLLFGAALAAYRLAIMSGKAAAAPSTPSPSPPPTPNAANSAR